MHLSNISSTKRGGSAKELVNKGGWAGVINGQQMLCWVS